MEEMAKRAQQQREAFLKQVQEQQAQRKSKNAKAKPPPPKSSNDNNDEDEIDNDDPVVGWSQVMKMAKPMKPKANQDQLKSVRKLYFSLKS